MRSLLVSSLALIVTVFAHDVNANPVRNGDIVLYEGAINHPAADALNKHFDDGARQLHINSNGGDISAGLSIARKIRERGVSVKVLAYCMSACANYVFLAAREKILAPGGILGFHGGPITGARPRPSFPIELGDMDGLRDAIEGSYAFYDEIKFNLALIDRSEELTRVPPGGEIMAITSIDGKRYSFSDRAAGDAWMAKLRKQGRFKSIEKRSALDDAVYFPDKLALLSCGVTGIVAYPYPASPSVLLRQAAKLKTTIKVIGEFRRIEGKGGFMCSGRGEVSAPAAGSRHTR